MRIGSLLVLSRNRRCLFHVVERWLCTVESLFSSFLCMDAKCDRSGFEECSSSSIHWSWWSLDSMLAFTSINLSAPQTPLCKSQIRWWWVGVYWRSAKVCCWSFVGAADCLEQSWHKRNIICIVEISMSYTRRQRNMWTACYIQTLYSHIPVATNNSISKLPETVIMNVLSSAELIEFVMIVVVCYYLPNLYVTHLISSTLDTLADSQF